jgi:hypothetical protein
MTVESTEFDHAERWNEWQRKNTETSRTSDRQVRVISAIMFAAVGATLAYQLFSR